MDSKHHSSEVLTADHQLVDDRDYMTLVEELDL